MGNKMPGGMEIHWPSYIYKEKPIYNEKPVHGPGFKDTTGLHLPKGARIPDWKRYRVEDIPELADNQRKLAAYGLKDPWARNEAWRFDRKMWGTPGDRMFAILKSFKYGVAAFILTVIYKDVIMREKPHGHPDPKKYPLINEKFDSAHDSHHH